MAELWLKIMKIGCLALKACSVIKGLPTLALTVCNASQHINILVLSRTPNVISRTFKDQSDFLGLLMA